MNFFKQLADSGDVDITLRIMQKGNTITINCMPGSANSLTMPINATGTPDELDKQFFEIILPGVKEVAGFVTNIEQAKAEAKSKSEAAAAVEKKSDKKTAKPEAKKDKAKTEEKPKPEKKPAPVKEEKPKPVVPQLFTE